MPVTLRLKCSMPIATYPGIVHKLYTVNKQCIKTCMRTYSHTVVCMVYDGSWHMDVTWTLCQLMTYMNMSAAEQSAEATTIWTARHHDLTQSIAYRTTSRIEHKSSFLLRLAQPRGRDDARFAINFTSPLRPHTLHASYIRLSSTSPHVVTASFDLWLGWLGAYRWNRNGNGN